MDDAAPWFKNYPPNVPHDVQPEQYRSLGHLLEEAFTQHAERPFSVCMDRWMSYGELDKHSTQMGAWLQSLGLPPDARVAIMLPNVPQFAVSPEGHPNSPSDGHLKLPHLS